MTKRQKWLSSKYLVAAANGIRILVQVLLKELCLDVWGSGCYPEHR